MFDLFCSIYYLAICLGLQTNMVVLQYGQHEALKRLTIKDMEHIFDILNMVVVQHKQTVSKSFISGSTKELYFAQQNKSLQNKGRKQDL